MVYKLSSLAQQNIFRTQKNVFRTKTFTTLQTTTLIKQLRQTVFEGGNKITDSIIS